MPEINNIFTADMNPVQMDGVKDTTMSVMIGRHNNAPHFSLRSFAVQPGGHTPKHQHDYEHEVYVVSGEGSIFLDGTSHPIRSGDTILVPANELHQFTVDQGAREPFRFLCMVPKDQNCGGDVPGS